MFWPIPIQALAVRSRKQLEDAAKLAASKQGGGSSVTWPPRNPKHESPRTRKKMIFRASS